VLEILKDREKAYRFVVKSREGHALLESVSFSDSDTARKTIGELKQRIRYPGSFERRTDHNGRFQFTLKDARGRVIGHSQLYSSEAGMENGITHTQNQISDGELKL
jgi:uncharacterized protein YegP (UPF0339 family)